MSYWAEFAHTGDPSQGRNGELTLWEPWSNEQAEARQIVFDEAAYGGVRMSQDLVNFDSILAEVIADEALEAPAKCELSRRMFPHLSAEVCSR
jgi:para-nitrobenzyl esterase